MIFELKRWECEGAGTHYKKTRNDAKAGSCDGDRRVPRRRALRSRVRRSRAPSRCWHGHCVEAATAVRARPAGEPAQLNGTLVPKCPSPTTHRSRFWFKAQSRTCGNSRTRSSDWPSPSSEASASMRCHAWIALGITAAGAGALLHAVARRDRAAGFRSRRPLSLLGLLAQTVAQSLWSQTTSRSDAMPDPSPTDA